MLRSPASESRSYCVGDLCLYCAFAVGRGGGWGRWWEKLRKTGPPSTNSQDMGSIAESLTGSCGAIWPQFCWAGSELGTRGEKEEILVRSDLWAVVELIAPQGSSEWLTQTPARKPLCFLWYRGSLQRPATAGSSGDKPGSQQGLLSASKVLLMLVPQLLCRLCVSTAKTPAGIAEPAAVIGSHQKASAVSGDATAWTALGTIERFCRVHWQENAAGLLFKLARNAARVAVGGWKGRVKKQPMSWSPVTVHAVCLPMCWMLDAASHLSCWL